MFIDSFAGALSDIPKKHQRDMHYVLTVLKSKPVFSAFDIDTQALAKTVDRLLGDGFMTYSKDHQYPWAEVVITDKGNEFLSASISPHPNVTQPETNLPISGLGGYDQVLRDEFEDGKK